MMYHFYGLNGRNKNILIIYKKQKINKEVLRFIIKWKIINNLVIKKEFLLI